MARGAVIGIKGNPYFEAAHAIGSPSWRTLLRHEGPNITAPIIIIYSITIGGVADPGGDAAGRVPDVPAGGMETLLSDVIGIRRLRLMASDLNGELRGFVERWRIAGAPVAPGPVT